jgi:NAD(P)H-nitrite reductase large subunit
MTSCYVAGRSVAELERLSIEELGRAYTLNDEQIPMFVPAFEALQSALAALAGRPDPFAFEGGMICTCLNVREGRIRRSIRERRLKTVEDVAHWTRACTGCRSCRTDVQRILIDEERRKKK